MRTFSCKFAYGVTATVTVPDNPPTKPEAHILNCEWTGQMPRSRKQRMKILRSYITWMNSINKQLADQWQLKLAQAFQVTENSWEFWVYEAGKEPRLISDKDEAIADQILPSAATHQQRPS